MDKYLTDAKLRWAQEERLRKLQDAAEHHKELVILKTIAYEKESIRILCFLKYDGKNRIGRIDRDLCAT